MGLSPIVPLMLLTSFLQMLPILLVVLGGYLLSALYSLDVQDLVKVASDFFLPALIFISLTESNLTGQAIADMAKASALVCVLLFGAAILWAKLAKEDIRSTVPPLVFMNSGFLGIPLMKLWGGMEAMNLILIYDQVQSIFMFTLGILVITGGFSKKSIFSMLHSPVLWSVVLGFLFRLTPLSMPQSLVESFTFAGEAASPLAAFALGVSIRSIQFHVLLESHHSSYPAFCRRVSHRLSCSDGLRPDRFGSNSGSCLHRPALGHVHQHPAASLRAAQPVRQYHGADIHTVGHSDHPPFLRLGGLKFKDFRFDV